MYEGRMARPQMTTELQYTISAATSSGSQAKTSAAIGPGESGLG